MNKYRLIKEIYQLQEAHQPKTRILYRIIAIQDFGKIKKMLLKK